MRALYVLRIRTVSNYDGLYGAYDPSTALCIRTVTIRTDRTDRTNRNTLCSDVIMRCTLRMWSEYGPLATLTVCTERTIRQLLLTVRNSATVCGHGWMLGTSKYFELKTLTKFSFPMI